MLLRFNYLFTMHGRINRSSVVRLTPAGGSDRFTHYWFASHILVASAGLLDSLVAA